VIVNRKARPGGDFLGRAFGSSSTVHPGNVSGPRVIGRLLPADSEMS